MVDQNLKRSGELPVCLMFGAGGTSECTFPSCRYSNHRFVGYHLV